MVRYQITGGKRARTSMHVDLYERDYGPVSDHAARQFLLCRQVPARAHGPIRVLCAADPWVLGIPVIGGDMDWGDCHDSNDTALADGLCDEHLDRSQGQGFDG